MLAGSLRTFPVEDLLAWLARRAPGGALTLERGVVVRELTLDGDRLTQARSNIPGEQLGQLLLGRKLIDEAGLAEAFRVQAQTGVLLGKILVMTDVLDEGALRAVVEGKIEEAVSDLLTWTEGDFRFDPVRSHGGHEVEVAVELAGALARGLGQVERRRALAARVPDHEMVFWLAEPAGDRVPEEHAWLLPCVEGGMSVNRMALERNGNRLQVLEGLAALLDLGVIKPERRTRKRRATEGMTAEGIAAAARGRADGGDRAGAWRLAGLGLEQHPDSAELRALHRKLERGLLAELTRELLASFRVPRLAVSSDELATAALDDAERHVAGRIDGRWDLLSLVRVAPLAEVEALLAFRRLAARGLVAL